MTIGVPPGQAVGFLGRHGAGKTTTRGAILDVVALEQVRCAGRASRVTEQARHRFGNMPEERRLYLSMQILDQLEYLGRLNDMAAVSARDAALMHDPRLLVLDAPFAGLDLGGVDDMTEILVEWARAGVERSILHTGSRVRLR